MNFPIRCVLTLAYAWAAVAFGGTASAADLSKVLGSVRLEAGQVADDVETVNGSVTIESSARAENVETVNGSITIEDRAFVESAETVNGDVTIGAGSEVQGDVATVNGDVTLRPGVQVGGSVANVNGDMLLEGATVAKGIETVNADIRIGSGSRVSGGIRVEKNNGGDGWLKKWGKDGRNPRITVEQGAVVEGALRFEREVDLYLASGVSLPPVQGVEPKRYTLQ
jgi:NDP-sugar pyrophosphorylase family protein